MKKLVKKTNKVILTGIIVASVTPMTCMPVGAGAMASQLAISQVSANYRTDNVKVANDFKVYLDGVDKTSTFSNPIEVSTEGRTLLPLRDLSNLLGCNIDWDANHKVAIVKSSSGKTIEVPIGSTNLIVNNSKQKIDNEGTKAIILSSRTYLPFRAIVEATGHNCDYKVEGGVKKILITSGGASTPTTPGGGGVVVSPEGMPPTFTELGYDATHGPKPGEDYYECWERTVRIYRKYGLTDEQITQNMKYIHACKDNGDGSGNTNKAQLTHFSQVSKNNKAVPEPDWDGTYKAQQYYYWQWDGMMWIQDFRTYAGLSGIGLR